MARRGTTQTRSTIVETRGTARFTRATTHRISRARIAMQTALAACAVAAAIVPRGAAAADFSILGQVMAVHGDTTGTGRSAHVTVTGREKVTDIASIADPRIAGATLYVAAEGQYPSEQTFTLEASGWSATAQGYRYKKPRGAGGHPVASVTLSAKPGGTAVLKVVIKGSVGTDRVGIYPPFPGTAGGITLTVQDQSYCVRLGGPAGGAMRSNTFTNWRITGATTEAGCLQPAQPSVCGNGIVESDEACDGSPPASCEPLDSRAVCGEPSTPHACGCCYPPGTSYTTFLTLDGLCCDNQELLMGPYSRYCGTCLPAGMPCVSGGPPCCSGVCISGACR